MKHTLLRLAGATLLATGISANAGTTTGGSIVDLAGNDTLILLANGSKVASGIATAGWFSISDAAVATAASAFQTSGGTDAAAMATLVGSFTGLGIADNFVGGATTAFGGPIPGVYMLGGGVVGGDDYGLTTGAADPRIGKTLYSFFGDGATFGASTQWALILHTGVTIDRDDNTPAPDSNDLSPGNPYQTLIGGPVTATTYDATLLAGPTNQPAKAIQMVGVAIPEPSAVLLGLSGALLAFRRRR